MRAKHHYRIILIKHHYEGDYFYDGEHTTTEKVIFETKKRAEAEYFYYNHLYLESGTIYKCYYYPWVEVKFVRDY